ncbi:hypothetical protein ACLB2K_057896 [Fragaria x ananassa]
MSSSISTAETQKHLYFSKAFLREEREVAEDGWLKILLYFIKQTRSWSETPNVKISTDSIHVDEFLIRYSSSNHRRGYTDYISTQLSELGVPLEQHPPILEKIFQVVQAAVPERRIVVLIADVTVRSDDHEDDNISRLIRKCCPVKMKINFKEDSEVFPEMYALNEIDYHGADADRVTWESFETQKVRFVPATTSSINSLKNVRLDGLEEAIMEQNPWCVICMDYFAEAGVDVQLITSLPCAHIYHLDCIVPWLKNSHLCPMCRYPMPTVEEAESSNP